MKAMILAAGRGERMRPLTDKCPKPLLKVDDSRCLIDVHIEKLVAAGIREIIINAAYLGEMIASHVGDGKRYGASIVISMEPEPLETAGAINFAKTLLGENAFLLVNGDVWSDIDYSQLLPKAQTVPEQGGYLVLVPNPPHKTLGDFAIDGGYLTNNISKSHLPTYTFSGISVLSPQLVTKYPSVRTAFPLREVFDWGIRNKTLLADVYTGQWMDIGTPERLATLKGELGK